MSPPDVSREEMKAHQKSYRYKQLKGRESGAANEREKGEERKLKERTNRFPVCRYSDRHLTCMILALPTTHRWAISPNFGDEKMRPQREQATYSERQKIVREPGSDPGQ